MKYIVKDSAQLRKLLWIDFALGFSTAITGIIFTSPLAELFRLDHSLILIISIITLVYAGFALFQALSKEFNTGQLRFLITANWLWAAISVILFFFHSAYASILGIIFLVLQVIVVGGLAYLEGNQLRKSL